MTEKIHQEAPQDPEQRKKIPELVMEFKKSLLGKLSLVAISLPFLMYTGNVVRKTEPVRRLFESLFLPSDVEELRQRILKTYESEGFAAKRAMKRLIDHNDAERLAKTNGMQVSDVFVDFRGFVEGTARDFRDALQQLQREELPESAPEGSDNAQFWTNIKNNPDKLLDGMLVSCTRLGIDVEDIGYTEEVYEKIAVPTMQRIYSSWSGTGSFQKSPGFEHFAKLAHAHPGKKTESIPNFLKKNSFHIDPESLASIQQK